MSRTANRARRRGPRKPVEIDYSVPSPCVQRCAVDQATDTCPACLRSMDEIRNWMIASREEKLAVLERIVERKKQRRKS